MSAEPGRARDRGAVGRADGNAGGGVRKGKINKRKNNVARGADGGVEVRQERAELPVEGFV